MKTLSLSTKLADLLIKNCYVFQIAKDCPLHQDFNSLLEQQIRNGITCLSGIAPQLGTDTMVAVYFPKDLNNSVSYLDPDDDGAAGRRDEAQKLYDLVREKGIEVEFTPQDQMKIIEENCFIVSLKEQSEEHLRFVSILNELKGLGVTCLAGQLPYLAMIADVQVVAYFPKSLTDPDYNDPKDSEDLKARVNEVFSKAKKKGKELKMLFAQGSINSCTPITPSALFVFEGSFFDGGKTKYELVDYQR